MYLFCSLLNRLLEDGWIDMELKMEWNGWTWTMSVAWSMEYPGGKVSVNLERSSLGACRPIG